MAKPIRKTQPPIRTSRTQPEVVDPRWLLRTLGLLVMLALLCGYLTLGLLFYLGSWQLALKPTHTGNGGTGLPTEKVRFGADPSGAPQLTGEWLPADPNTGRAAYTLLYLRGADGQLDAADGTQIATLRASGLNAFAFDYRGYGSSVTNPHPTEQRMLQDAESAWTYLTEVQKIASHHILVFGSGVGVSLAGQLLESHPSAAGLIGYNADPEVLARVQRDPRSKLFPIRLVFHDRFDLDALQRLRLPKLLYSVGSLDASRTAVYRSAADPKLTVEVPTHNAEEERAALARFLDNVLPEHSGNKK